MKLLFFLTLGVLLTGCQSSTLEKHGKLSTYKQCITRGVGYELCEKIAGMTSKTDEGSDQ